MALTSPQTDRALGAILASAAGDALGAPYEFGPAALPPTAITAHAGGGWELGEWTDDTAMALPILSALADGRSLDDEATLDRLVGQWIGWSTTAKDVGIQIRAVLRDARQPSAAAARAAAVQLHERRGRSGGNGSLMRTGPVALGYLERGRAGDAARAARAISDLTHFDVDAGDACVIWTLAIRRSILTGDLDLERVIAALPEERQQRWRELAREAELRMPWELTANNGWVVGAFQAAWSAIVHGATLAEVLELAVRSGKDTDTVAAIAGSLAGAVYGASALPAALSRHLHGSAGEGATGDRRTLIELATLAIRGVDSHGWPTTNRMPLLNEPLLVPHPADPGVWLGDLGALDVAPASVTAVVSLCRVGREQARVEPVNHIEVRLIDQPGKNPHLDLVLTDAADAVAMLRAEGHEVLLHCAESRSRTAAVAALYAVRHRGASAEEALAALRASMPRYNPQPFLVDAVRRLAAEAAR